MAGTAGSGNFRFTWKARPAIMAAATGKLATQMESSLMSDLTGVAAAIESYMKNNAPWQDRTGDARRGLQARANQTGAGNFSIIANHTVSYGGFLETGTSRMSAYPILGPGLQAHYAQVRSAMDKAASFGGGGAKI